MTNHKQKITPFLWFDSQAKEAAEFYCSIFQHSKIISASPMVINFELNGQQFIGLNGGTLYKVNPSVSFFVLCESLDETNQVWNKLMEDGKALMPIDKYPWSERYGWVQDKFGITWQVSINDKEIGKQSITPSLLFTSDTFGKAEEAIRFYTTLFENSSIDLLLHYENGDANAGKVLYSEFNLSQYKMIAMDGPGVHDYSFNEGVSFMVHCETQKEVDYFWDALISDGGQENMCGWLKDKFGLSWQIIPNALTELMSDKDEAKSQRVIQAILKMKKIDIEVLENAYNGQ